MESRLMLYDESLKEKLEQNYPWTGIYKLRCLVEYGDGVGFVPVRRVAGTDLSGVLYIGSSDYLPNRVWALRKALLEAKVENPLGSRLNVHTCGKKYMHKGIQELFPFDRLCIEIISSDKETHVDSHYILENEELGGYERQFGEPPPLNEGRK